LALKIINTHSRAWPAGFLMAASPLLLSGLLFSSI
jgi:hypothetical protein